MKNIILILVIALWSLKSNAQIEKLSGPRFGVTFLSAGLLISFMMVLILTTQIKNLAQQGQLLLLSTDGNGRVGLPMEGVILQELLNGLL